MEELVLRWLLLYASIQSRSLLLSQPQYSYSTETGTIQHNSTSTTYAADLDRDPAR